jgi:hypothetical protein
MPPTRSAYVITQFSPHLAVQTEIKTSLNKFRTRNEMIEGKLTQIYVIFDKIFQGKENFRENCKKYQGRFSLMRMSIFCRLGNKRKRRVK